MHLLRLTQKCQWKNVSPFDRRNVYGKMHLHLVQKCLWKNASSFGAEMWLDFLYPQTRDDLLMQQQNTKIKKDTFLLLLP
jgi:hypothetical protein